MFVWWIFAFGFLCGNRLLQLRWMSCNIGRKEIFLFVGQLYYKFVGQQQHLWTEYIFYDIIEIESQCNEVIMFRWFSTKDKFLWIINSVRSRIFNGIINGQNVVDKKMSTAYIWLFKATATIKINVLFLFLKTKLQNSLILIFFQTEDIFSVYFQKMVSLITMVSFTTRLFLLSTQHQFLLSTQKIFILS